MAHEAEYYQGLADRYEAIAASMTAARDRETIASVAAQYHERAADARRRERGGAQFPR
jgi:hypothetical protein